MRTINSKADLKQAIKDGMSEGIITDESFMKEMIKASEKSDYVKFRNDEGNLVRAVDGNIAGISCGIVASASATILSIAIGLLIVAIGAAAIISVLKDENTEIEIDCKGKIIFKRKRKTSNANN